ncbi:MAG: hypothetical protein QOH88_1354 [Verrucomicrobiota bacterium]|jgi:hypothetical protein
MKRNALYLVLASSLALIASRVNAEPPAKTTQHSNSVSSKKSGDQKTVPAAPKPTAVGWTFTKGEWVHSDGYKFTNGKVVRTTAKTGTAPKPPSKLMLENAQKLNETTMTDAEKKAEQRRKNLAPSRTHQTGSNL